MHCKKMWRITRISSTLQKTGTRDPLTGTRNPKQEQCLFTVFIMKTEHLSLKLQNAPETKFDQKKKSTVCFRQLIQWFQRWEKFARSWNSSTMELTFSATFCVLRSFEDNFWFYSVCAVPIHHVASHVTLPRLSQILSDHPPMAEWRTKIFDINWILMS